MRVQELLGINLPIIQAPMAGAQGSKLAIAVSAAGGLGSLPCAMLSPEQLLAEIEAIRGAGSGPYNLNFFCHTVPEPDEASLVAWQKRLSGYYREFGLESDTPASGGGRQPFSHEIADIIEPFRPPVVSFHFGLPEPELLERVRGWGSRILSSATTVEEALWLDARGVDAIIAQGVEAGGHRGMFLTDDLTSQMGTMALVPQIVQAVNCPVIAAGGIADSAGVAAALALGAAGVQIGTAYLCCPESTISDIHRGALMSEAARHTALTNVFSGRPARGIVNRVMRELGPICEQAPAFPLATAAIAPLRAVAESQGLGDFSPLWSGQNASGCKAIPAAELTRQLAAALS
ncbi:MAG: nitronate monooxygenase [Oceanospirillales bacterium]|nr:nitronate monooxygenase [Oceanospirillales bacterium]